MQDLSLRSVRESMWTTWPTCGLFCLLFYFVLPPGEKPWVFTAMNMMTAIAILLGVRMRSPRRPAAWLLTGIGLAVYGSGKTLWFFYDPINQAGGGLDRSANILFGLGYALIAAALWLKLRARDRANFRNNLMDAMIMVLGMAVLWWVLLAQPVIGDHALTPVQRLVSGLYPFMDLVMLILLVGFLVSPREKTVSEKLVVGGVGAILLADGAYYWAALTLQYTIGGFSDVGWLIGFLLLGTAALHPTSDVESGRAKKRSRITERRLTLFVAAALAGPVTLGIVTLYGGVVGVGLFASSSIVLFSLVLVRMAGLIKDGELKMEQIDIKSRSLESAERKYRTLVEQIPAVTYLHMPNAESTSIYMSPRIEKLMGFTAEEWVRDPERWSKRLHPEDRIRVLADNERSNRDQKPFVAEYRMIHRDGHPIWVRDESVLIRDASSEPAYWQGVLIDITERKELEEQLVHQAFHDPLTGLANRALFADRVEHALSQRGRSGATPLAVLFVDLDDFKTINDSLGHAAGDKLLRAVAERIQASLRLSDTAARLGGDEFGILVEDIEVPADVLTVAKRVTEALDQSFSVDGRDVGVKPSIGIAVTGDRRSSVDELLRNADLAMYMAKRERSGYAIYEPEMHTAVVGRMQLKADLEKAIENEELELHYQPIVDLESYRIVGTESLVRWKHPERGLLGPGEFIMLAEETDLVERIGEWVLSEACKQARDWQDMGFLHHRMTINLSARQLHSEELVTHVRDVLEETGVRPELIALEITESAIMKDVEKSAYVLGGLKGLGVRIAVDDFGTGYSSLSYLQRFPVDILKIDKLFVDGIERGSGSAALAKAVIRLGETLNLMTIAEGVELREQCEVLRELGCQRAQGFYFSPGRDAASITELLARDRPVVGAEEVPASPPA